jgi:hypothetical protein
MFPTAASQLAVKSIAKASLFAGLTIGSLASSHAVPVSTSGVGVTGAGYETLAPQFTCQSPDGLGSCVSATGINFLGGLGAFATATGGFVGLLGSSTPAVTFLSNITFSSATPMGTALLSVGSQNFYWTDVTKNYKGNVSEFLISGFFQNPQGGAKTLAAFDYTTQTSNGFNFSMQTIPVPGTVALLGLGMIGAGLIGSRRRAG